MVKNHLSRLEAPASWPLRRKGIKFVTRPDAGPHALERSIPLAFVLTTLLKKVRTNKEVKNVLNAGKIFVNGKVRKERGFPVGIMDVVSIPTLKENYRVIYDRKGKFALIAVSDKEADIKASKILSKKVMKGGKIQLNMYDGSNIRLDKDAYKTGDTLLISVESNSIKEHLPLEKGVRVFLSGGKKRGHVGVLDGIKEEKIVVNVDGEVFETAKKHAYAIGDITVSGEQ